MDLVNRFRKQKPSRAEETDSGLMPASSAGRSSCPSAEKMLGDAADLCFDFAWDNLLRPDSDLNSGKLRSWVERLRRDQDRRERIFDVLVGHPNLGLQGRLS